MPHESKWKFYVCGYLTRGVGGPAISKYDAIVESGIRDDASPHALRGVGPIAHPKDDGMFYTWYMSAGANHEIETPDMLSIFLRVARGEWKPYLVKVSGHSTEVISNAELLIKLGAVVINPEENVYVDEP